MQAAGGRRLDQQLVAVDFAHFEFAADGDPHRRCIGGEVLEVFLELCRWQYGDAGCGVEVAQTGGYLASALRSHRQRGAVEVARGACEGPFGLGGADQPALAIEEIGPENHFGIGLADDFGGNDLQVGGLGIVGGFVAGIVRCAGLRFEFGIRVADAVDTGLG